jgi:hypothetical protein
MIGQFAAVHPCEEALRFFLIESRQESIQTRLRGLIARGYLHLPRPGSGESWPRFRRLAEIAAEDLSLARLAEGHADSHSILSEAGLGSELASVDDRPVYALWVAGPPLSVCSRDETVVLSGRREYCSGAGIVERALVTGRPNDTSEPSLFEIDAMGTGLHERPGSWPAVGMAATNSVTLDLDQVPVLREVGEPGFYQQRIGFWLGSLNVAACWYGGALGLARDVLAKTNTSADLALYARIDGALLEMRLALRAATIEIDAEPLADNAHVELLALRVRDCVYRNCKALIEMVAELGGTFLSTRAVLQARRLADLPVYLRQYHPSEDRARIGELIQMLENNGADRA